MLSIEEAAKEFAKEQAILNHKFVDEVDKRKAEHACYKAALQMAEFCQRWIPVEEELPDTGYYEAVDVWVKCGSKTYSVSYIKHRDENKGRFYIDLNYPTRIFTDITTAVTHWRKIKL